ncbi:DUF695 domain-containing protein [Streptomyces sp. 4.24]|uniref:DUF695 domain-containing protein n=1 Tax=Streptomyces tritrimontium TaxID=3406573 RepID=UPI003BB635F9
MKPSTYPDDEWTTIGSRIGDSLPLTVRRNTKAADRACRYQYFHKIVVAVPLVAPDGLGMPKTSERETLFKFEEWLDQWSGGMLTLVIIGGGRATYIAYLKNAGAAQLVESRFAITLPAHQGSLTSSFNPHPTAFHQRPMEQIASA